MTVAVCFLVGPREAIWIFYVSTMTWDLPSLSLQFTSAMTAGLCDHAQLYSAVITARPHTCQSMTSTVELYSQLPENQKLAYTIHRCANQKMSAFLLWFYTCNKQ